MAFVQLSDISVAYGARVLLDGVTLTVAGGERIYLVQLAHRLGLDAAVVSRLEAEVAARVDASN